VAAVLGFFAWQFKSRINKGIHLVNWIHPVKLAVRNGMNGATGAVYAGLPEFEDMAFVAHFLHEKDLFIDVGSNVGIYSLLASGVKGARSKSFEPIAGTFESLQRNIAVNQLEQKIEANHMGVGSKKDVLHFTADFDTVNHVVYDKRPGTIEVPVDCLDTILQLESEKYEAALMKIDVEGFEMEVLKGGRQLLQNTQLKAVIMEMNGCGEQFGVSDEALDQEISEYGFNKYRYDPFSRQLEPMSEFNKHGNTIYIRDIEFAKKRIKQADKITVFNSTF
jgi:FkbM family methyltransferase